VKGALYSVFYSKTKSGFVTNTIKILKSPHINVLLHSEVYLTTITSEGNARTLSLKSALKALIYGVVRADLNINRLAEYSVEA
jgi:hypothetical protein